MVYWPLMPNVRNDPAFAAANTWSRDNATRSACISRLDGIALDETQRRLRRRRSRRQLWHRRIPGRGGRDAKQYRRETFTETRGEFFHVRPSPSSLCRRCCCGYRCCDRDRQYAVVHVRALPMCFGTRIGISGLRRRAHAVDRLIVYRPCAIRSCRTSDRRRRCRGVRLDRGDRGGA